MLSRVHGPECPQCGCEASTLIDSTVRTRFDAGIPVSQETIERRECDECGRRFHAKGTAPPADAVAVQPVRCPRCDSPRTVVTSSPRPVRYHRCLDCRHNFKSLES